MVKEIESYQQTEFWQDKFYNDLLKIPTIQPFLRKLVISGTAKEKIDPVILPGNKAAHLADIIAYQYVVKPQGTLLL
jgi:hypothetical protein